MKCLFINPCFPRPFVNESAGLTNRFRQPLDLAYPAAVLEKEGYDVNIIDANVLRLNLSQMKKIILNKKPEVVVITTSPIDRWQCPYLDISAAINTVNLIKNSVSSVKVILTGPHGTVTPEWLFKQSNNIDFVIRGEPEITILELMNNLEKKDKFTTVNGLSYRHNDVINHYRDRSLIENLDELPFPAYHLLPMNKYEEGIFKNLKPVSIVLTSRGCPYKCVFCLKCMYGDKYRNRSPQNVINELELLVKEFQVKAIYFQDLEFVFDTNRTKEICESINDKKLKFKWACSARVDRIDGKLLKIMKKAGCVQINYGVESGSQKILNFSKKGINIKKIKETFKMTKENGIKPEAFLLIPLPGEKISTIKESIKFSIETDLLIGGNPPIPYPGTKLFELACEEAGRTLNWSELEIVAGTVGTDLIKNLGKNYKAIIAKTYLVEKYGRYYLFNPKFYNDSLKNILDGRRNIRDYFRYLKSFLR
nr:radical SAM protein [Candidatus Borrarchaeum sp.]